jgi:hypothetical protein
MSYHIRRVHKKFYEKIIRDLPLLNMGIHKRASREATVKPLILLTTKKKHSYGGGDLVRASL